MANTTWSTTDFVSVGLTGGNLTATATAGSAWVRAKDKQLTNAGKFYWEVKVNVWSSTNTGVGFCPSALASPPYATTTAGLSMVYKAGTIYNNGSSTGIILTGSFVNNDIIGIALDLVGKLAWFRQAPSGNWNASGTANPATGVGGISVSAITGVDAVPLAGLFVSGESATANFGDTAFSGVVPSGFTAGWPGAATNALATQIAAEQWFRTNPDMQLTQVALEHWASVSSGNLQLVMTQIALEQWASVASVSATQSRVWIMA